MTHAPAQRTIPAYHHAPFALIALTLIGCLLIPACSKQDNEQAAAAPQPVVHSYALRGRIVSLPDPADPASELRIHHEAINDFKMGDGEAAPMMSMTMAFAPGPDESLDDLKAGDAIEFVFEMQWEPAREMRVVSIRKLPDDVTLEFESPDSTGGADHAGH